VNEYEKKFPFYKMHITYDEATFFIKKISKFCHFFLKKKKQTNSKFGMGIYATTIFEAKLRAFYFHEKLLL
jgi:hypothetical protein